MRQILIDNHDNITIYIIELPSYQTCLQGQKKDNFPNIKEIGKITIIKKSKKNYFYIFFKNFQYLFKNFYKNFS